jgi:hypothetical protein
MRSWRPVCAICSVLLACVVAACGGGSSASDNGVASKSPKEIVTSALNAIDAANSAHVAGSVRNGGTSLTLDLDLLAGRGGRGNMSLGGLGFQVEVVGDEVYLYGTPAFWQHYGGPAGALLDGKWVKAPTTGRFAQIAQLTDLHALVSRLLTTHHALVKTGTSTVNGQKAVGVRDASRNGTLYVATTGKPYPLVLSSSQLGHLTLSRFNESVTLTPPANALDLSQLSGLG